MPKYLSGRSKVTPLTGLSSDRYRYLSVSDSEPNLGDPLVGPSSITAKPVVSGQQYIIVGVEGYPGERYWIPNQGGIIPGSISVFEEGSLIGGLSSTTQLDFRGNAITAEGLGGANPGYAVTITFAPPGNEKEVIFKQSNDFATDSTFTFDSSINLLSAGDRLTVGAGGTVITTTGAGFIGIGTTNPTGDLTATYDPNLHVEGNIRLTGTIIDRLGDAGSPGFLLVKEDDVFGGLSWTDPANIPSGGAGDYRQVQFKGSTGLLEGADFLYYDEVNNFVGIGSTQPTVRLDVIGKSNFDGDVIIERNLSVGGISTFTQFIDANGGLDVFGQTDLDALNASGLINFTNTTNNTLGNPNSGAVQIDGGVGINENVSIGGGLDVDGNTTVDALTASELVSFTNTTNNTLGNPNTGAVQIDGGVGINQNVSIGGGLDVDGNTELDDLNVSGTATIQTLNLTSLQLQNLKVTGIATFDQQVNINNLSVTGVATVDNIKIDTNTVSTLSGNIIIDSSAGTTQINDALYVNDATESTSKDTGSVIVEGGVGIEKRLNVGGEVSFAGDGVGVDVTLASAGGITTTGGDLYVGGNAYIDQSLNLTDIFADNGTFNVSLTSASLTLNNPGIAVTAILDEDNMVSDRADALATQQSIKAYVDAQVGNQDLDFSGDTGTGAVDLDTQVFDIGGVVGDIKTTASGQSLTIESDVTGVVAGTYGSATRVGIITVNDKGKITAASDVAIDFSEANVETANRLATPREISFSEDVVAVAKTFDGSQNVGFALTLATVFDGGTYGGEGDKVLSLTVDDKGRITGITSVNIDFGLANVATADSLTNARQIAATGDIDWSVSFKGHEDVSGIATLATVNGDVGTYGSGTQIPVITVDEKGRITGVGLSDVDGGGGGGDADRVSTGSTNGTGDYFLTFVDSDNSPRESEYLYTDCALVYNPSTDQLTITGGLNVTNNVTLGDSSADTLLVNASIGSTIIPDTTDFYDLGSSASTRWKTVYAQTICADNYCGAIVAGSAEQVSVGQTNQSGYLTFVTDIAGSQNVYVDTNLRYNPDTNDLALDSNLLICDNKTICIGDSLEFNLTYCLGCFAYDSQGVYEGPGLNPTDALNRYDISGNKIASCGKAAIFEETGTGPVLFRALGSGEGAFEFFSTNSNDPGCATNPEEWVSLLKMHGGSRGFRLFQCDANLEVVNVTGAGVTVAGNIEPWVGLNPQENGRRSCTTSPPLTNNFQTFTSGTFNLGSPTNKWNTVYADNICATNITGTISGSASQVSVATTNGSQSPYFLTFVGGATGNQNVYTDSGIQYNSVSNSLTVAGDTRICGILTVGASSITLDGSANTVTVGTGITIGSTTTLNQLRVNSTSTFCGTITPAVTNTYNLGSPSAQWGTIYAQNFSGNIIGSADQIKTTCTTANTLYYLTFVDSNNATATAETLYTNGVTYNPSSKGFTINGYLETVKGGSGNVLIGDNTTGSCLTTGGSNTLVGSASGRFLTCGDSNTFIGVSAGESAVVDSCRSTFLGYAAGVSAGSKTGAFACSGCNDFNISIGYLSGQCLTGDYLIAIGNQSAGNACGFESISIGHCAGYNGYYANSVIMGTCASLSSAIHNEDVIIGCGAGGNNLGSVCRNILIGCQAGYNLCNTNNNTFIGRGAGFDSTTGQNNIAIGRQAGNDGLFDIGVVGVTTSNNIIMGNECHTLACIAVPWSVKSDIRYKCVWGSVPHGREFLRGVNPIKYSFKDEDTDDIIDGTIRYGFSAQEILALEGNNPVIVSTNNPERYGLTTDYIIPILVNAIKQLDTENTNLKQRLVAIEQHLGL